MKKILLSTIMTFLFSINFPTVVFGDQWKLFEHRYPYKLEDVLQATKFTQKKGYWEGYKDNKLVGYVVISKDWTKKLVGYSGKHLETLIGFDTNGTITGVKLIFHSEPIVLIGLKEEQYLDFIKQYKGKNIKEPLSVGREIKMDAITGATVTAVVQNSIILETSRKVAESAGIMKVAKAKGRKISQKFSALTWDELKNSGAVKNLVVTSKDLGMEGSDIYLDLFVGVMNAPSIGRNLAGDSMFNEAMSKIRDGGTAIAIVSKGSGSFKGSGFARGGVFDRFNIEQGSRVFMLTDKDYRALADVAAKGAPDFREGGVFIIKGKDFDPTEPFRINFILPFRISATKKDFKSFSIEYEIPQRFLE